MASAYHRPWTAEMTENERIWMHGIHVQRPRCQIMKRFNKGLNVLFGIPDEQSQSPGK